MLSPRGAVGFCGAAFLEFLFFRAFPVFPFLSLLLFFSSLLYFFFIFLFLSSLFFVRVIADVLGHLAEVCRSYLGTLEQSMRVTAYGPIINHFECLPAGKELSSCDSQFL